jgi:hypothetical protein
VVKKKRCEMKTVKWKGRKMICDMKTVAWCCDGTLPLLRRTRPGVVETASPAPTVLTSTSSLRA